eukprot:SAG31_NODE_23185_length_509_cov_1.197561_1_plen_88_part_00
MDCNSDPQNNLNTVLAFPRKADMKSDDENLTVGLGCPRAGGSPDCMVKDPSKCGALGPTCYWQKEAAVAGLMSVKLFGARGDGVFRV